MRCDVPRRQRKRSSAINVVPPVAAAPTNISFKAQGATNLSFWPTNHRVIIGTSITMIFISLDEPPIAAFLTLLADSNLKRAEGKCGGDPLNDWRFAECVGRVIGDLAPDVPAQGFQSTGLIRDYHTSQTGFRLVRVVWIVSSVSGAGPQPGQCRRPANYSRCCTAAVAACH